MKRNVFLLMMLAVVLAFSMAVVGCSNGSTGGNGGDNTPADESDAITITGFPPAMNGKSCFLFLKTANTDGAIASSGEWKTISNGTFSSDLYIGWDGEEKWAGKGTYEPWFNIYGEGGTQEAMYHHKDYSFNFTKTVNTFTFSQFELAPEEWW